MIAAARERAARRIPARTTFLPPRRSVSPRSAKGFTVLVLLAVVLGVVPRFGGLESTDVAWLIHAAERVLGGTDLYGTLVETNPPLAVWASMPAVLLADVLPLDPLTIFHLLVGLLIAASLLVTHRELRRAGIAPESRHTFMGLAVLALVLAPGWDFGQREHLAVILTLPYWTSLGLHGSGREGPGASVGLAAAIGLAFKPPFLLLVLAAEGWLRVRDGSAYRWRRRSLVVIVFVFAVYAAAALALEPDYRHVVTDLVLPHYAHIWPLPWHEALVGGPALRTYGGVLGAFLVIRAGDVEWGKSFASLYAVLALVWLAVAALQQKAFPYHYLPPVLFAYLAAGAALVMSVPRGNRYVEDGSTVDRLGPRGWAVVVVLAVMTMDFAHAGLEDLRWVTGMPGETYERLQATVTGVVPHEVDRSPVIASLTINVWPVFPLVNHTDARWALRHPSIWPVHAARSEAGGDSEVAQTLRRRFVEDLLEDDPDLLMVRDSAVDRNHSWDVLDYFLEDDRFARWFAGLRFDSRAFGLRVYVRE